MLLKVDSQKSVRSTIHPTPLWPIGQHWSPILQTSAKAPRKWNQCVAWCACLLPSLRQYQIILHGDRGKCARVACPCAARYQPTISNRKSNAPITMPSTQESAFYSRKLSLTVTFLNGGQSSERSAVLELQCGRVSIPNREAVSSLYKSWRHQPDMSQNRTEPSSCLQNTHSQTITTITMIMTRQITMCRNAAEVTTWSPDNVQTWFSHRHQLSVMVE